MKNCLIYQPYGLGDVLWCIQVADHYINKGYTVYFPVGDLYYNQISSYIKKDNLIWVRESDNFPLKYLYGTSQPMDIEGDIYLPLSSANYILPHVPLMVAKIKLANVSLKNWWDTFEIERNYQREKALIDKYDLHGQYILINKTFGTHGISTPFDIETININSNIKTYQMTFEEDFYNGFHLFDWIGALEKAKEIHTVHTSVCYLIDKYCKNSEIHMYERKTSNQIKTGHAEAALVFRNSAWIYEN